MNFLKLAQLVDMRGKLKSKGSYSPRKQKITTRVWHHSLTLKSLAGSTAAAFANYHVDKLGWPGAGYAFIIEPKNVVQTSKGPRAKIVYANDINRSTYHVGNSNPFSLGICVAGDYRKDKLDDATLASIRELHEALVKDGIGSMDKSHNEMPGYSWKECCVYDYRKAINWQGSVTPTPSTPMPEKYTIQQGDTFYSIAGKDGAGGVTVDDLIKANPGVDPKTLKIGQVINIYPKAATPSPTPSPQPTPTTTAKTIDQLAREVLDGKHGNGDARKKSLGSNYAAVQKRVNEIASGKTQAPVNKPQQKSISQLADEVMKGLHGTGAARKKSLGSNYDAVQKEVNRRLKK